MIIKKILEFSWKEFIYGGHLLALGAGAIVISAALLLDERVSWDYPVIIYLIAYTAYLYNRYKEVDKDFLTNPKRTQHLKKYIRYVPLIIWCVFFIIIGILVYSKKLLTLPFILFLFLGGLLYTVFFKKVTKKITAFKNFFVALEWTLPIAFLPIYYSFSFSLPLFLIIIFVYLKTFIVNSYFDTKDVEVDEKEKLLTLPITLSLNRYLVYLKYLTLLFGLIIILSVWFEQLPIFSLILVFTIPFNFYIFKETQKSIISPSRLYFLAGGEFIIWPILLLIGKIMT
ncbi:MAG: UbiA family prenyltransferase [Patescibacteria group bacterium]|nr:UbiA family prenyltransferase [Patescibacteria group bacterium]